MAVSIRNLNAAAGVVLDLIREKPVPQTALQKAERVWQQVLPTGMFHEESLPLITLEETTGRKRFPAAYTPSPFTNVYGAIRRAREIGVPWFKESPTQFLEGLAQTGADKNPLITFISMLSGEGAPVQPSGAFSMTQPAKVPHTPPILELLKGMPQTVETIFQETKKILETPNNQRAETIDETKIREAFQEALKGGFDYIRTNLETRTRQKADNPAFAFSNALMLAGLHMVDKQYNITNNPNQSYFTDTDLTDHAARFLQQMQLPQNATLQDIARQYALSLEQYMDQAGLQDNPLWTRYKDAIDNIQIRDPQGQLDPNATTLAQNEKRLQLLNAAYLTALAAVMWSADVNLNRRLREIFRQETLAPDVRAQIEPFSYQESSSPALEREGEITMPSPVVDYGRIEREREWRMVDRNYTMPVQRLPFAAVYGLSIGQYSAEPFVRLRRENSQQSQTIYHPEGGRYPKINITGAPVYYTIRQAINHPIELTQNAVGRITLDLSRATVHEDADTFLRMTQRNSAIPVRIVEQLDPNLTSYETPAFFIVNKQLYQGTIRPLQITRQELRRILENLPAAYQGIGRRINPNRDFVSAFLTFDTAFDPNTNMPVREEPALVLLIDTSRQTSAFRQHPAVVRIPLSENSPIRLQVGTARGVSRIETIQTLIEQIRRIRQQAIRQYETVHERLSQNTELIKSIIETARKPATTEAEDQQLYENLRNAIGIRINAPNNQQFLLSPKITVAGLPLQNQFGNGYQVAVFVSFPSPLVFTDGSVPISQREAFLIGQESIPSAELEIGIIQNQGRQTLFANTTSIQSYGLFTLTGQLPYRASYTIVETTPGSLSFQREPSIQELIEDQTTTEDLETESMEQLESETTNASSASNNPTQPIESPTLQNTASSTPTTPSTPSPTAAPIQTVRGRRFEIRGTDILEIVDRIQNGTAVVIGAATGPRDFSSFLTRPETVQQAVAAVRDKIIDAYRRLLQTLPGGSARRTVEELIEGIRQQTLPQAVYVVGNAPGWDHVFTLGFIDYLTNSRTLRAIENEESANGPLPYPLMKLMIFGPEPFTDWRTALRLNQEQNREIADRLARFFEETLPAQPSLERYIGYYQIAPVDPTNNQPRVSYRDRDQEMFALLATSLMKQRQMAENDQLQKPVITLFAPVFNRDRARQGTTYNLVILKELFRRLNIEPTLMQDDALRRLITRLPAPYQWTEPAFNTELETIMERLRQRPS